MVFGCLQGQEKEEEKEQGGDWRMQSQTWEGAWGQPETSRAKEESDGAVAVSKGGTVAGGVGKTRK